MMSWPDFKYKQIIIHKTIGEKERLRFRADNLIIEDEEGKVLVQQSCHKIFAVFIIGDTTLISVIIKKSVAFSFPIILMNHNFKVVSRINCAAEGNTLLRRVQYSNSLDNFLIAKELIRQKIRNQSKLLGVLRYQSIEDKEILQKLKFIDVDEAKDIHELMGIEGSASKLFFSAYFRPLGWKRREPRCKRDIYNLLLDIGYTYLFNLVEAMLCLYGFDLYQGVLHTNFYQRKSLVCDIVEPFRCIIDKRLRKAYNLGQINEEDFFFSKGQWSLEYKNQEKYTKLFVRDLMDEKENIFMYCQQYYRWLMKKKSVQEFPVYNIVE